jgi:hypothetical protein
MTVQELLAEELPDLPEDARDYVLWNYTGWPEFWNIPEDGATPEECLRKQLRDYRERVWAPETEEGAAEVQEPSQVREGAHTTGLRT